MQNTNTNETESQVYDFYLSPKALALNIYLGKGTLAEGTAIVNKLDLDWLDWKMCQRAHDDIAGEPSWRDAPNKVQHYANGVIFARAVNGTGPMLVVDSFDATIWATKCIAI